MIYKREVEDLEVSMKSLIRERRGMLDLSPTDAQSLVLATDFDAKAFVAKDIELGIKIHNLEKKIGIAKERYAYLFTGKQAPVTVEAGDGPLLEEGK